MAVQFPKNSLKKIASLAGAAGVGLTLTAPALAETSIDRAIEIALTPTEQDIINDYKPPKTETYIPDYRVVELNDVKSFLCTNNSTPECGFEVPEADDDLLVPSYGVTDEERKPGSMVCANNNNPLCENPLNYGREFDTNTAEEFQARTRSLWAELDEALAQRRPAPDLTPPPRPAVEARPAAPAPAPTVAPAPVPGLW
ncbi:MAG: hypothetical protein SVX43_11815 [Cyanobacteriota bacterium]|nr:hypothetical protein [Cyanobacteriota bacterium]